MKRARLGLALAVGLAALAIAACSSKGKSREPAELVDIANPEVKPQRLWSASPGTGDEGYYTGLRLRLEEDALFGADADGRVFAVDPANGRTRWLVETRARVISGPTVGGGIVLVGTLDGEVIALKRADGTKLWTSVLSSEVLAPPATDGERVVARTSDGRIYGLSGSDGARLWSFDRSVPNLTLRGLSPPLISGLRVVSGLDNGHLIALKLTDGQLLWDQAVAVPSGRTELERLTDIDAALLEGSEALYALSFGGELAAVDTGSGEVMWRRSIKSYTGATELGQLLVVSDADGLVWALDARTGAAAWKQEGLRYRRLSPPVALGEYIVVGDFEGYLHWIEPRDGKIVARTRVGGEPIPSAPVSDGQHLYVLNSTGDIAAITAAARN